MDFNTWQLIHQVEPTTQVGSNNTQQNSIINNLTPVKSFIPQTASIGGSNMYFFNSQLPESFKADLQNQGFKFYETNNGVFAYKPQNFIQRNAQTIGLGLQGIGAVTNLLTSLEAIKGIKEQIKLLKQQRKQQEHEFNRLRKMRNSVVSAYNS